ncbi:unnamed protein product [Rhodiola kirilowii]
MFDLTLSPPNANAGELSFEILKKWDEPGSGVAGSEFITKHLFPCEGLEDGDDSDLVSRRNFQQRQQLLRRSRRGPRSKSSQYRGVTFYRRTGRWESHIWDCGKQVYLGGFDTAQAAAR